jgi:parallel beta-helix repeat protein
VPAAIAALLAVAAGGCDLGGGDEPEPRVTTRPEPPPARQPERSDPSLETVRHCDRVAAPWGSDAASGLTRFPFATPGRLVASLRPGEAGCLRGGTYTQEIVFIRALRATIRSAPRERATWRGRIVIEGRGTRLADLTLDGTYGPLCDEGRCGIEPSPTINAADVTIADSDITNREGICVHPAEFDDGPPDRYRIVRNRIHDCGRRPPTENDHGIYVAAGLDGVIAENVIYRNADRGIQLYPATHRTTIERNTVDGNGSGIIFSEQSSNNIARDNVFSNSIRRYNAESFDLDGGGNRFVDNCVVPGHPDERYNDNGGVRLPDIVEVTGNIGEANDPFRDRAHGDFRLRPGTRCARKGAPEAVAAPR